MKLTVFRQDYQYQGNGVRQHITETLLFETAGRPGHAVLWRCHFDPQTRVLRVLDEGGDVKAAISRVDYFHVGDVTVEKSGTEAT